VIPSLSATFNIRLTVGMRCLRDSEWRQNEHTDDWRWTTYRVFEIPRTYSQNIRHNKRSAIRYSYGKRGCGRPKTRMSDNVKNIANISMASLLEQAQDISHWRSFVESVTAGQ